MTQLSVSRACYHYDICASDARTYTAEHARVPSLNRHIDVTRRRGVIQMAKIAKLVTWHFQYIGTDRGCDNSYDMIFLAFVIKLHFAVKRQFCHSRQAHQMVTSWSICRCCLPFWRCRAVVLTKRIIIPRYVEYIVLNSSEVVVSFCYSTKHFVASNSICSTAKISHFIVLF